MVGAPIVQGSTLCKWLYKRLDRWHSDSARRWRFVVKYHVWGQCLPILLRKQLCGHLQPIGKGNFHSERNCCTLSQKGGNACWGAGGTAVSFTNIYTFLSGIATKHWLF